MSREMVLIEGFYTGAEKAISSSDFETASDLKKGRSEIVNLPEYHIPSAIPIYGLGERKNLEGGWLKMEQLSEIRKYFGKTYP